MVKSFSTKRAATQGGVLQKAVGTLDYPLVQGSFLILAMVVLTANLLVDLVSAALDPRIRAE